MENEYPKWRFHKTLEAVVVRDYGDERARTPTADGWVDHPSQFAPDPPPEPIPGAYPDLQSALKALQVEEPQRESTEPQQPRSFKRGKPR
jgi:hypothetical protein